MHKAFDLWWTGCQTKGHQHRYLQTNPALSPVMTAHHPQSLIYVSDRLRFSLYLFLLLCASLTYECEHTHTHTHINSPPLPPSPWLLLVLFFFLKERLPCCQADVGEAGEGGRKQGRGKENVRVVDE